MNPTTPGVSILEIPTLPSSIAELPTSIPAFIGYTQVVPIGAPRRITSLPEYEQIFGGPPDNIAGTVSINENTTPLTITGSLTVSAHILYYAMSLYFQNGGGPCYVASAGTYAGGAGTIRLQDLLPALRTIASEDEPTLIVIPEAISLGAIANYKTLMDEALLQCEQLKDRFVIMDMYVNNPLVGATPLDDFRTLGIGADNLKYGAVYYPSIETTLNYVYMDSNITVTHTGGARQFDTLTLDAVANGVPAAGGNPAIPRNIGFYNAAKRALERNVHMGVSPAVAGTYVFVDTSKAVWHAPANVSLKGVVGPNAKISATDQGLFNVDASSGKSVNIIRTFKGRGTLIWGSRTLAGNDNEWRYVPVRRMFIWIEESIQKALELNFVFRSNDSKTWLQAKSMIESLLTRVYDAGGLMGAKASDSFRVAVGLGQTMNMEDVLEGRMNIAIGLCAVRPAEFIILKFSHYLGNSSSSSN